MGKLPCFFPLQPLSFFEQDYGKEKRPGTSYQPLFQSQNIFTKIVFWSEALNLEIVEEKKIRQNIEYFKNKKSFLEVMIIIFE